ncbi:hypothetical protein ABIA10_007452 [Rhizobium leguminosarum]
MGHHLVGQLGEEGVILAEHAISALMTMAES